MQSSSSQRRRRRRHFASSATDDDHFDAIGVAAPRGAPVAFSSPSTHFRLAAGDVSSLLVLIGTHSDKLAAVLGRRRRSLRRVAAVGIRPRCGQWRGTARFVQRGPTEVLLRRISPTDGVSGVGDGQKNGAGIRGDGFPDIHLRLR